MFKKLFIGNLSKDVTSNILEDVFSKFGIITSCKVIKDKNFGFVEYDNPHDAREALSQMDDHVFHGLRLHIQIAKSEVNSDNPRISNFDRRERERGEDRGDRGDRGERRERNRENRENRDYPREYDTRKGLQDSRKNFDDYQRRDIRGGGDQRGGNRRNNRDEYEEMDRRIQHNDNYEYRRNPNNRREDDYHNDDYNRRGAGRDELRREERNRNRDPRENRGGYNDERRREEKREIEYRRRSPEHIKTRDNRQDNKRNDNYDYRIKNRGNDYENDERRISEDRSYKKVDLERERSLSNNGENRDDLENNDDNEDDFKEKSNKRKDKESPKRSESRENDLKREDRIESEEFHKKRKTESSPHFESLSILYKGLIGNPFASDIGDSITIFSSNDDLSTEQIEKLFRPLKSRTDRNRVKIDLKRNSFSNSMEYFANLIKENVISSNIRCIDLSLCERIEGRGIEYLCDALEENTSIKILDLSTLNSKRSIEGEAVEYLTKFLSTDNNITSINLFNQQLDEDEYSNLLESIKKNSTLTSLLISNFGGVDSDRQQDLIQEIQFYLSLNFIKWTPLIHSQINVDPFRDSIFSLVLSLKIFQRRKKFTLPSVLLFEIIKRIDLKSFVLSRSSRYDDEDSY